MDTSVDKSIAHIGRLMRSSLRGELGGSSLPSAYWRQRLHQIVDSVHLTDAQRRAIDALLLELDEFDLCNDPAVRRHPIDRAS